jgi:hypothetical protein
VDVTVTTPGGTSPAVAADQFAYTTGPISSLRSTAESLRALAAELTRQGHRGNADTVADLLHEEGFRSQGSAKTLEGGHGPDRDAQVRYINEQTGAHQASGDPVVSVDTKKKKLAGAFRNGGREWGERALVGTHDFAAPELGKAIPHGAALPLTRHDWHGDWNYTLHPAPPRLANASPGTRAALSPGPDRTWLHAPALTGLTTRQWDALTTQLTVARYAQREASLHQRRGGPRQVSPGTGRKAKLTLADRAAITLLALRFALPKPVLARLFGVSATTIAKVISQTQPLLNLNGHNTQPGCAKLATLTELIQFATNAGIPVPEEIKSAC